MRIVDNQCILCTLQCTLQHDCSDNNLFVYATTPILRTIVESHLLDLGVRYESSSEVFLIKGGQKSLAIQGLRSRLSDVERADIRVSGQAGGALMAASTLDCYGNNEDTDWFDEALKKDKFSTYFQPIMDTSGDTRGPSVFAHECLTRLFSDRVYNGGEIMEAARSRGRIHLFDSYTRRLSIRNASAQFVAGTKVFINFTPTSIYDPKFCMASTMGEMLKTSMRPRDIVFEVVESEICDYYRQEGFGFALDDVGTGSSSMQMMCDLKPDYVKLDKSLISKISDPMYLAAVQKLTELAMQFGLNVIAEGVEAAANIEVLQKIGIHLMQGYYFGKPAPRMCSMQQDLVRIQDRLGTSVQPSSDFAHRL